MPDFSVVLLAGGSGTRMNPSGGGRLPKQFMPLGCKRVIDYSLDTFLRYCTDVIVALPDPAGAPVPLPQCDAVRYVQGGATRDASIVNALAAGVRHDRVLVHDAARPFVTRQVIASLLAELERHDAACPVIPVVNSIVVDEDGFLAATPERSHFHEIQTPQAFRTARLAEAMAGSGHESAHIPERIRRLGGRVRHVAGTPWLFKITYAPSIHAAAAHWRDYLDSEG